MLRGTFVLTLGTYISRILGMIYIIPFYAMVGTAGSALYQYGYAPYAIFLSVATAGFPAGVSKYVAKYNALGDYKTSRRMFKGGLAVMLLTGFLAFAVLYFLAPVFAESSLGGQEKDGVTVDDVVLIIRMVSLALIVVPIMSLIRGFFQGHQSMGPTAVSQVVEQIVRIAFLLGATYYILKIYDDGLVLAIGYATFAAFVGAVGGLAVLFFYWMKRKNSLTAMRENAVESADIPYSKMFGELFRYAGPFVFVGLAIPLYIWIDTNTFNKAMTDAGYGDVSQDVFAVLTLLVPKLVMIPVSLATAFGLTLIPAVTESFTSGNRRLLTSQIDQTLQMIMFLVLPAVVGLSILAGPAYTFFYRGEAETFGPAILAMFAPAALLFSLFTVNAAILQGINKQKLAVISLVIGVLIKLSLNVPLIHLFQGAGSILATVLGYSASLIYGFAMIKRHAKYSFKKFFKRSVFIMILAVFMGLVVSVVQSISGIFIDYSESRINALIVLILAIGAGAGSYLYLAYRSHLLEKIIGNRFSRFFRRKARG